MKHPSTGCSKLHVKRSQITGYFRVGYMKCLVLEANICRMEESQVSVAPLVSKSLTTKATDHVQEIPICKVERRNVQQKRPNYGGSWDCQNFRPRAVLSSPENDHLIGGQDMIYFKGKTEMSQKKIGRPCTTNYGKEALVKKSVLKHNKTLGLPIEKDQAPVP